MNGRVVGGADLLGAELVNLRPNESAAGRLVLVTAGLDGRVAERVVGNFTLPVGGSREVTIRANELPIQSEVALSFAAIVAEVDRPDLTIRVSTRPLYYRFQKGYSEVAIYNADEAGKIGGGDPRAQPSVDVEGRILEADGTVTNAADAFARSTDEAKAAGKGQQVMTTFGRIPVDPSTGRAEPPFTKQLSPTASLQRQSLRP